MKLGAKLTSDNAGGKVKIRLMSQADHPLESDGKFILDVKRCIKWAELGRL